MFPCSSTVQRFTAYVLLAGYTIQNLKSNLQQSILLFLAESTEDFAGSEATPLTAHPPTHTHSYWFGSCKDPHADTGIEIYFCTLQYQGESCPPKSRTDGWHSQGWGKVGQRSDGGLLTPQVPCGWTLIAWKLLCPPTLLLEIVEVSPLPGF